MVGFLWPPNDCDVVAGLWFPLGLRTPALSSTTSLPPLPSSLPGVGRVSPPPKLFPLGPEDVAGLGLLPGLDPACAPD